MTVAKDIHGVGIISSSEDCLSRVEHKDFDGVGESIFLFVGETGEQRYFFNCL